MGAGASAAAYLAVDGDTVALWTLDRSLADSGPSALTLTLGGGLGNYAQLLPGIWGKVFDGLTTFLERAANDPVLTLLGAMTVQAFVQTPTTNWAAGTQYIAAMRTGSHTPPTDTPWILQASTAGGFVFTWSDAVSAFRSVSPSPPTAPSPTVCLVTATRASDGSGELYVNKTLVGTLAAGALPANGSGTRLSVGRNHVGTTNFLNGWLASLRVKNVHLDATQVAADYDASLGLAYPLP
jgi:hypothetical protein